MNVLTQICVAALFILSPSLLQVLGIGYSAGNPVFGIHPSTYLLIFTAAALFGLPAPNRPRVERPTATIFVLIVCAVTIPFVMLTGDGGFKIAVLLVTFVSPALLLLILRNSDAATPRRMAVFLNTFMIVNSLIGFYEFTTRNRLLPYVTGAETILYDPRPTALLGHPLNNALVTGGFLLSLLILAARRPKLWTIGGIAFFAASMLSFGGRASLVAVFVVFAFFGVYQAVVALLTMRAEKSVVRMAIIVGVLALAAPIVLSSPLAAAILDRFANSGDSDKTRWAALTMLTFLSPMQMITGVSTATRTALQMQLQSAKGVELSWVSLTLNFGLPAAAALVAGMISLLWTGANRNRDQLFVVLFYVIATFTALSIGSRALSISQFLVILYCGPLAMYGVQRSSRSGRAYKVVKRRIPAPGAAGAPADTGA